MDRITRRFSIPLILVCYGFAFTCGSVAYSQDKYVLSEATYRQLLTIQELREAGKSQQALKRLQSLALKLKGSAYEYAVVLQTMGYVYHTLGQDDNAAHTFEQALAQESLPEKVADDLRYNLSQLLISAGRYRKGLQVLTPWLNKGTTHPPEAYFLAAIANYHLGRCAQAIGYLNKAMAANKAAPESWYQLILTCHYELSQFKHAARILETMIKRFPHQYTYWMQLAGVYQRLNRNRDALVTMELAYRKHRLKADDVIHLVRLYLYLNMPYPAAQLLQAEMAAGRVNPSATHWILLADSYYLAHEHEASIRALRNAAELVEDGGLYFRLGQLLYEREQWQEAMNALQAALNRKGLKHPDRAHLLLGIAALRSGDRVQAQRAFADALEFASTRTQASQWLQQLREK